MRGCASASAFSSWLEVAHEIATCCHAEAVRAFKRRPTLRVEEVRAAVLGRSLSWASAAAASCSRRA